MIVLMKLLNIRNLKFKINNDVYFWNLPSIYGRENTKIKFASI